MRQPLNCLLELLGQVAVASDAVALSIECVLARPGAKHHLRVAQEIPVDGDVDALNGKRCGLQPGGVGMVDSFPCDTPHICSGRGHLPEFRVFFGELAHGRNLCIGAFDGTRTTAAVQLRLDPNGKELRIESALARANRIEVSVGKSLREIHIFINEALRSVSVHIDGNRAAMNRDCVVVFVYLLRCQRR